MLLRGVAGSSVMYSSTAQKMKFSMKCLVTFTEEIVNRKFHFLCNVVDAHSALDIHMSFNVHNVFRGVFRTLSNV